MNAKKDKHTPGPWVIEGQDIFGNDINGFICTWSGRRADAELIIAAPAMKELLEKLVNTPVENQGWMRFKAFVKEAEQLLKQL